MSQLQDSWKCQQCNFVVILSISIQENLTWMNVVGKGIKKFVYVAKKNQIILAQGYFIFRKMGFVILKCVRQAQGSEYR